MSFDFSTLITDRTNADVSALSTLLSKKLETWTTEELEQFNNGLLKGGYWWTDLNRVTACMAYLDEELRGLGYESGYVPVVVHETPEPEKPLLPDGYTQLEYIESTGSQYIDTGIKPNDTTRVIFDCCFPSQSSAAWLFGARAGTYVNTYNFLTTNGLYRSDYGNESGGTPFDFSEDRFEIDKNGPVTYINGKIKDQSSEQKFSSALNLYLFGNNNNGVVQGQCKAKGFKSKIYNDGGIVRDYIPCKNQSGVAGLYDLVDLKFSASEGASAFVAGPEVITDQEPQPEPTDQYTWYREDSPKIEHLQQYIDNVAAIRSAFDGLKNAPEFQTSPRKLTAEMANNIEKTLEWVESVITTMRQTFVACGTSTCGGDYL